MNFKFEPRNDGNVIILGAGASFGACLPHTPPIMRDFVKIGKNLVSENYSDLWHFLDSLGFSSTLLDSGNPNLEELYSILNILSKGLWHDKEEEFINEIGQAFWKVPPVYFLESFIMEVTNISSIEAVRNSCIYHDYVVRQLSKGDTIISFNYDLLVDVSVAKCHQWSELDGYGFVCIDLLRDYEDKYDANSSSEIALLKPHGSLNWRPIDSTLLNFLKNTDKNESITFSSPSFHQRLNKNRLGNQSKLKIKPLSEIKHHAYEGSLGISTANFFNELVVKVPKEEQWKFQGVEAPQRSTYIIPPGINKFTDPNTPEELSQIWATMRKALSTARNIVIIGYSFPPTDLEFNTLFRLALNTNKNNSLKVQIVDPNVELVERIQRMTPRIKVEHIANSLKDYVK